MFDRDPCIPLTEATKPRICYLGDEEVMLSLEALKNKYMVVTKNLRHARGRRHTQPSVKMSVKPNQLVTLKIQFHKTLNPRYEGAYHVFSMKGNQVEVAKEGSVTPTKWFHLSHVKLLLKSDQIIDTLPAHDMFGRKTKLAIHPDNVPDLNWGEG